MHFLFETSEFNELDHFSPVATQLLEDGHSVTFVTGDDPRLTDDSRVRHLSGFPGFETMSQATLFSEGDRKTYRFLSRLFFGRPLRHVLPNRARLSLLVSCSRAVGVYRKASKMTFDCGISGWGDPTSVLMTAVLAAGKPIVSLPHGYPCIKNDDFNQEVRRILETTSSLPDFSVRNAFAAYVVATRRNESMLRRWNVSQDVLSVWGNARFSPRWVRTLVGILPPFDPGRLPYSAHRVLFLLPSPTSTFRRAELASLLRRLSELPVVLLLKPHTRNNTHQDVVPADVLAKANVVDLLDVDTTRLIDVAETVINFATGAALDAIHLDRRLIFAKYLSPNSYSWEDCDGIKVAESEDECVGFVMDRDWSTDVTAAAAYLDQEVFADGQVADPVSHYANRLVELALLAKR